MKENSTLNSKKKILIFKIMMDPVTTKFINAFRVSLKIVKIVKRNQVDCYSISIKSRQLKISTVLLRDAIMLFAVN